MNNNLSTSEIYNNADALQMLLHALCKSVSITDQEFNLKYDVYERLMRTYNRWRYGAQMTAFGSLTYYCLKANGAKSKLIMGFLYIYWINHFFTVGSFIGITLSLPKAMRHLQQADEQSNLFQQLTQIQNLIRNRKEEYNIQRHVLKQIRQMYKNIERKCINKNNPFIWMDNIICQMKMDMLIKQEIQLNYDQVIKGFI